MNTTRKAYVAFFIYAVLITVYFALQPYDVPAHLIGTPADPRTFLTPQELDEAQHSLWIRESYAFIYPALQCLLLILIYQSGMIHKLTEKLSKVHKSKNAVRFVSFLSAYLLYKILLLPVRFCYYLYRSHLGLTEQPFLSWLSDRLLDIGVGVFTEFLVVLVIWSFIRRFKQRWWIFLWCVSIPVIFLFVYVKPVLIDPLYNQYTPIQNQALKAKILRFAQTAGVPAQDVYEADVSKQTTTINAYVTGIGSSLRIVLWDTTLKKLNDDEIIAIVAHEMGHYQLHHVMRGTVYAVLGAFAFFAVTAWVWRVYRKRKTEDGPDDFAALLAILLLLLFLSNPFTSRLSYGIEKEADDYAASLVHNPAASITLHQKLAKYDKAVVSEPWLSRLFYGTHPTIQQRIEEDMQQLGTSPGG
ncbi:M48 family metallopeptidase [Cohnella pontilimi]|nr:M48 family metallopeptidase [Cohnella pontilimi]